jgi:hypothetical protein
MSRSSRVRRRDDRCGRSSTMPISPSSRSATSAARKSWFQSNEPSSSISGVRDLIGSYKGSSWSKRSFGKSGIAMKPNSSGAGVRDDTWARLLAGNDGEGAGIRLIDCRQTGDAASHLHNARTFTRNGIIDVHSGGRSGTLFQIAGGARTALERPPQPVGMDQR